MRAFSFGHCDLGGLLSFANMRVGIDVDVSMRWDLPDLYRVGHLLRTPRSRTKHDVPMESIDQGATRYVQDLSAMHVVRSFPVEPVLVASSPLRAMIPIELLPAVSRVQIITTTVSREHMKRETPRI